MPSVPFTTQTRVARFRDQRWLIDKIVELAGPEFDQSRLHYYSAPMSPDLAGAVMGLAGQIKRWDDMTREFARTARRFELQAIEAQAQGACGDCERRLLRGVGHVRRSAVANLREYRSQPRARTKEN